MDLIAKAKMFFPHAKIVFQSVLPMKINKDFTAYNFSSFNDLLYHICKTENCFFLDIFDKFLVLDTYLWRVDYNKKLYRDNLHLNHTGLGRLVTCIKNAIKNDLYNPVVIVNQRFK